MNYLKKNPKALMDVLPDKINIKTPTLSNPRYQSDKNIQLQKRPRLQSKSNFSIRKFSTNTPITHVKKNASKRGNLQFGKSSRNVKIQGTLSHSPRVNLENSSGKYKACPVWNPYWRFNKGNKGKNGSKNRKGSKGNKIKGIRKRLQQVASFESGHTSTAYDKRTLNFR